jgi:predicted ABC-type ATPase
VPRLTIVIGSNGAGKSTWCRNHRDTLPEHFYNPDSIAEGMGDWNSRSRQREAGEFVRRRIKEHLEKKESFGFETTYSGRSSPRIVERAKTLGYEVRAVFIGTRDPEINVERVAARVKSQTGHGVGTSDIRRRWSTAQDNLARTAEAIDRIELLDNSEKSARVLGHINARGQATLLKPTPQWAKHLAANIEEAEERSPGSAGTR